MPFDIDSALGIHQQALSVRSHRAEILATNLANADTPNFKARDIDFKTLLGKAQAGNNGLRLSVSHASHLPATDTAADDELLYRTPAQPSADGNTVDTHMEHAEFMRNALRYQASLTFINGRIRGLLTALKGD